MSYHFLVFQHTEWAGPGKLFFREAEKHGVDLTIIKLWKQEIPSLSFYDALIVLGGKPNVSDQKKYPFLNDEKRSIRESLKEDRPYLGICLGHQLLAEALGARVDDNYCISIGFIEGFKTRKGKTHPLLENLPLSFPLFKWHCQSVIEPIPRNIDILVTSSECQVEAISIKGRPHIVGLQFDNHASSTDDVKRYLSGDERWLATMEDKYLNNAKIIHEANKKEEMLSENFAHLFSNFIQLTQRT